MIPVLQSPRQSGKTTWIVQQTLANDGILIVHNASDAQRLRSRHPALRVHVAGSSTLRPNHTHPVYVDNIDIIVAGACYDLFGVPADLVRAAACVSMPFDVREVQDVSRPCFDFDLALGGAE